MNGQYSLTISLPPADAEFVRSYAEEHHLSLDQVFNSFVRTLRRITTRPVDAELESLVGILPPETDVDALRMAYLTEKFLSNDRHH